ncbi:MAG: response regulator [Candidatus Riflebacteria bacterium]|nr:response regulator [Candidatus Riflebacteria bacterium]
MIQTPGSLLANLCVLAVIPDEKRLAEYLIEFIPTIPGVGAVSILFVDPYVCIGEPCFGCKIRLQKTGDLCEDCPFSRNDNFELYHFKTSQFDFGNVLIKIYDKNIYEIFHPNLTNSFILISIQLENIRNRKQLQIANEALQEALKASKTNEAALRDSETKHREMIANISDVIALMDVNGKIKYLSPNINKWFGWHPKELVEIDNLAMVHPDDLKRVQNNFSSFLDNGKPVITMEYRFKCHDKSYKMIELTATNLCDDPIINGVLMNFHDITERKMAEAEQQLFNLQIQQTQKLESLGVLAGGIAHDFNNILMVILGHTELAMEEISPVSPARSDMTKILMAVRRAAELCRQMLAYAGKASFAQEHISLHALIEGMADLLRSSISKKVILNLNLENDPPQIQADPSQIRQIVLNLIVNASDAIGDRSGEITVSTGITDCSEEYLRQTDLGLNSSPGTYAHIEVTDTGCGMDAATRSRIFDPFYTTKFTGRGLGLAAVLGIVRAHRGTLKVNSEPCKGTSFRVLFPALKTVAVGQSVVTDLNQGLRGHGTILLADDEEELLALNTRMLEKMGFSILTATNGRDAVDIYSTRNKEIRFVILDLTMPHMDGAEAFDKLRQLNPDVKVIIARGYTEEDVIHRFEGKGLTGVLQKPFSMKMLKTMLEKLCL